MICRGAVGASVEGENVNNKTMGLLEAWYNLLSNFQRLPVNDVREELTGCGGIELVL